MNSIFYITALLTAGALQAAEVSISISQVGDYARRNNPALAAARLRIEEARGRLLQSGRKSNPEADLSFSHTPGFSEGVLELGIMQKFPLTARLRIERQISKSALAAAEAEHRDAARKIAAAAEAAAVKLVANAMQRKLHEQQLATSRESAEIAARRAAAGEGSMVDAAQLQLEGRQLVTEILLHDSERAALIGELKPMLGLRAGDSLTITGNLPAPAAAPALKSADARPDIAAARHLVDAARGTLAQEKAAKWQDIGVGLMATAERLLDEPEGLRNEWMTGIRISLPLPVWNKNEGRIAEAAAAALRAEKEVEALKIQAQGEISGAHGEMTALAGLITEMDSQLIPKAREIEQQLRTFYDAAQATLADVLRATDRRLEIESRRVDALRDYHLARVRFDAATAGGAHGKNSKGSRQ